MARERDRTDAGRELAGLGEEVARQFKELSKTSDEWGKEAKQAAEETRKLETVTGLAVQNFVDLNRVIDQATQATRQSTEAIQKQTTFWKDNALYATSLFVRGVRESAQAATNFARQLLPLPGSVGGAVRQTQQAAGGGALTTLEGSWQLVLISMAQAFLPMLLYAAKALQDFARGAGEGKTIFDKLGRGAHQTGIPVAKEVGAGLSGFSPAFGMLGAARKEALEALNQFHADELKRQKEDIERQKAMSPAVKRLFERHGGEAGGLETFQKMFADPEYRRVRQQEGARQLPPGGGGFQEFVRKMFEATAPGARGRQGGGAPLTSQPGFLHGAMPPGYRPVYSGYEAARDTMQQAALGTSPLQAEIERQKMILMQKIYDWLNENMPGVPQAPGIKDVPRR